MLLNRACHCCDGGSPVKGLIQKAAYVIAFTSSGGSWGKTKVSPSLFCCSLEGAAYGADISPGEPAHFWLDLGRGRQEPPVYLLGRPLPAMLACFVHHDWPSPQRGRDCSPTSAWLMYAR